MWQYIPSLAWYFLIQSYCIASEDLEWAEGTFMVLLSIVVVCKRVWTTWGWVNDNFMVNCSFKEINPHNLWNTEILFLKTHIWNPWLTQSLISQKATSGRMLADHHHWSCYVVFRRHLVWMLQSVRGFFWQQVWHYNITDVAAIGFILIVCEIV